LPRIPASDTESPDSETLWYAGAWPPIVTALVIVPCLLESFVARWSAGEQPAATITTAAVESRQKNLGWKANLASLRDSG